MVGLHVLPPAVLAVLAVGNQAGHSERRFAALKGVEQVRIPQLGSALLVQNGQTGVLVVLKGEIAFGGVVRVFLSADSSSRICARSCSVSLPPELKCRASWLRLLPTLLH